MLCKENKILKQLSITSIIVTFVLIIFCSYHCFSFCEPGDSSDNPIIIGSKADLEALAKDVNDGKNCYGKHIILNNDIVIENDKEKEDNSDVWESIGSKDEHTIFDGTFNGNGHTITFNRKSNSGDKTLAIFGTIGKNGSIENLNINGNISSSNIDYDSILCHLNYGNIKNCTINVNATSSGSISSIATENYGTIEDCFEYGKLSTESEFCSGITIKNHGVIKGCYINTTLKSNRKIKSSKVSGVAIYNNNKIEDCTVVSDLYNNISNMKQDDVNGMILNKSISSGVACINNGEINNCSYIGDLSSDITGGIAGQNNKIINNCGVSANINGDVVGGITSINSEDANIKNCYCVANIYSNNLAGEVSAINKSKHDFDTCLCDIKVTNNEK